MCRILFCPPNTSRKAAIDILANMYGENEDGTGEVYLKDGKFVINKYAQSLEKVLKKGKVFLNHFPHNGWTAVHIRKASCGQVSKENAHPFISIDGSTACVHNGTLPNTRLLSIYLQSRVGYVSNTDSAAATELIAAWGMKQFTDFIDWGGVFGALNLDGSLEIGKISGQLGLHYNEDKTCLISSEFDDTKYKNIEMSRGWFKFDAAGHYVSHKIKSFEWSGYKKVVSQAANWQDGIHYQSNEFSGYEHLLPAIYGGKDSKRTVIGD